MTHEDRASYDSTPPCKSMQETIKRNKPLPLCETNPLLLHETIRYFNVFVFVWRLQQRRYRTWPKGINPPSYVKQTIHVYRDLFMSLCLCDVFSNVDTGPDKRNEPLPSSYVKQTLNVYRYLFMSFYLYDVFSNVDTGSNKEEYTPLLIWNKHLMCTEIFLWVCVCVTSLAMLIQDPIMRNKPLLLYEEWTPPFIWKKYLMCTEIF